MRIFLSCQQSQKRHPVPGYGFWETYFKRGIEEAGHEWAEASNIDWAEGLVYSQRDELHQWRQNTWPRVVDAIKQQHQDRPIDLFLSYLFPKQVEPEAIQEIQALGIPCVNFFCDNVRELTKVPKAYKPFDLHWVPEFKALTMYEHARLPYLYAPMPVWVAPEHRTTVHPENYGVSFIGSRDAQRAALLARVLQLGADIEIRGTGWNHNQNEVRLPTPQPQSRWQTVVNQWNFIREQGFSAWYWKLQSKSIPNISEEFFSAFVKPQPNAGDYIKILQQSRISLGINRYPSFHYPFSQPDTYSRMRDIEAPMMGACYLTEWTEGLDQLYDLGKEIETYGSAEELLEKTQILNKEPGKRQKLRSQGQKRALSEHTIASSLSKIQEKLGMSREWPH